MNQKPIPQEMLDQIKNDPSIDSEFKPIREWPKAQTMTDLTDFTDTQLRLELAKREKEAKTPPSIIENPDLSRVVSAAKDIVQNVVDGRYHEDNDDDHYIFEAVMEALYGPDFWDWLNNNTE